MKRQRCAGWWAGSMVFLLAMGDASAQDAEALREAEEERLEEEQERREEEEERRREEEEERREEEEERLREEEEERREAEEERLEEEQERIDEEQERLEDEREELEEEERERREEERERLEEEREERRRGEPGDVFDDDRFSAWGGAGVVGACTACSSIACVTVPFPLTGLGLGLALGGLAPGVAYPIGASCGLVMAVMAAVAPAVGAGLGGYFGDGDVVSILASIGVAGVIGLFSGLITVAATVGTAAIFFTALDATAAGQVMMFVVPALILVPSAVLGTAGAAGTFGILRGLEEDEDTLDAPTRRRRRTVKAPSPRQVVARGMRF